MVWCVCVTDMLPSFVILQALDLEWDLLSLFYCSKVSQLEMLCVCVCVHVRACVCVYTCMICVCMSVHIKNCNFPEPV